MILLSMLMAFPAFCAPVEPAPALEESAARLAAGIGQNTAQARAFEGAATDYSQAPDLDAAAGARAREGRRLNDDYWRMKKDLYQHRNELKRRELAAAADAYNTRSVDRRLLKELTTHLETASDLDISLKTAFKAVRQALAADAEALAAERAKRARRGRRRRAAAGAAAALLLALVLLRGRAKPPPPSLRPRPPAPLRRPKGPGRLE